MFRSFLLCLPLLFFACHLQGQYGEHTWFIGGGNENTRAGIRFGSDNLPRPYNGVRYPLQLQENNILVADGAKGDVIFYSDGQKIIDGSHRIMPGGAGLRGTPSNMYGTSVVYDPAGCRQYYLFYGEDETATPPRNLYYAKIDADLPGNGTLANPLGDVLDGQRNIPLVGSEVNISEGIFALPKNDGSRESWLFAGQRNGNRLLQFEVTAAGVSLYASHDLASFFPGVLRADDPIFGIRLTYYADRGATGRLVVAVGRKENNSAAPLGVMNFNRVTGMMEDTVTLIADDTEWTYGLAFSPDGTKLYFSDYFQNRLRQYDFDTEQLRTVGTSSHNGRSGGLRLAPDGRIYWANVFTYFDPKPITTLARINRPNAAGDDCELVFDAISFAGPQNPELLGALPTFGSFPEPPATEVLAVATCGQPNGSASVATPATGGPFTYTWDNGETSSTARALTSGLHTVTLTAAAGCTERVSVLIDSVSTFPPEGFQLRESPDSGCNPDPDGSVMIEHPALLPGADYTVDFLHVEDNREVTRTITSGAEGTLFLDGLTTGTYRFEVTGAGGCSGYVPFDFMVSASEYLSPPEVLGPVSGCVGDTVVLEVQDGQNGNYSWTGPRGFSATGPCITLTGLTTADAGTYSAVRTEGSCRSAETDVRFRVAEMPEGAAYDTTACTASLSILPGGDFDSLFWGDGTANVPLAVTTTGRYGFVLTTAAGCEVTDSIGVTLAGLPESFLPETVEAEQCDSVFLLPELDGTTPVDFAWSGPYDLCTDCPSARLFIGAPGTVTLRVTDLQSGCFATDSTVIVVNALRGVYVPNAFTPNGDGRNDGFTVYCQKPGALILTMDIYDRWGSHVYHVEDIPPGDTHLGWTGQGVGPQAGGRLNTELFVYAVTLRYVDGSEEVLTGGVYLVR